MPESLGVIRAGTGIPAGLHLGAAYRVGTFAVPARKACKKTATMEMLLRFLEVFMHLIYVLVAALRGDDRGPAGAGDH